MSDAPTLADAFLRESFRPVRKEFAAPTAELRGSVARARKFYLDDEMSAFMADLAWASLLTCESAAKAHVLLDSMRVSARLPHELTWIEFSGKAKARRARLEYGSPVYEDATPERLGWLCCQHPKIQTAFTALEFVSHSCPMGSMTPTDPHPQPGLFSYAWRSDDGPMPWTPLDVYKYVDQDHKMTLRDTVTNLLRSTPRRPPMSSVLTGVTSYDSAQVSTVSRPGGDRLLELMCGLNQFVILSEIAGDLRYLWALLATINDLPISSTRVEAAKGYVARGRYRKYSDHTVITLNVPERRYRRVAARAIAITRRRAHDVRGHWRENWKHPGVAGHRHEWESGDDQRTCACGRRESWIPNHQRGDASLGFVLHDYAIKHDEGEAV